MQRRVSEMLASCRQGPPHRSGEKSESPAVSLEDMHGRFHYTAAPTLAHVLALFIHPPAVFPPQDTSLVVIDSLATLVDNAYPRHAEDRQAKNKTEQARWAAGRRFSVVNELISAFTRFAARHDIALLITSQTITRIRGASRALLVPAISGVEWETGISTRLVLFRDWVRHGKPNDKSDADRLQRARFAGLVKVNGVALAEEGGVGNVVAFTIETVSQPISRRTLIGRGSVSCPPWRYPTDAIQSGLCDISITANDITAPFLVSAQTRPSKRAFAEIDEDAGEEPNSDELYGWIEDDEVGTEGLLIDEALINEDDASSHLDVVTDSHRKKITRTSPAQD